MVILHDARVSAASGHIFDDHEGGNDSRDSVLLLDSCVGLPVIISLGAFILPLMAQRVKIPGIVLEIAFGIVVGPLLGLVDSSEFINGLAILGFLLLMFLSGFEIELDTFREQGVKTLAIPMTIYLLTVATSFYLISSLNYPIFLALVLCTTSVDIVITILRSDDTIKTQYGQTLFMVALLADILTLLAATVYASFINAGGLSLSNLNVILYFVGGRHNHLQGFKGKQVADGGRVEFLYHPSAFT